MARNTKDVSIIIVNYNTPQLTLECIKSVIKHTKEISYEMIVVDNASTDESSKILKHVPQGEITFIQSKKNLGFAGGNNLGIKKATGNIILLLNSDTVIKDNVIAEMYTWMISHPNVGIATPRLKGIDNRQQAPGGYFPTLVNVFSWMTIEDLPLVDTLIKPFHPHRFKHNSQELDWVTGTVFFIKREVIHSVGLLDEDYFMYTEEVDYCYRAKGAGWKMWYVPTWTVIHYGKASSNDEYALMREFRGIQIFFKKNYPRWQLPLIQLVLKIGAFLRIIAFTIVGKPALAKIYAKTFTTSS